MRSVVITSYDGLVDMLRERADELGATREQIDYVGGLQQGYCGKLLGPRHVRTLGRVSFGCILQALGIRLVAIPDEHALARVAHHYGRRRAIAASEPQAGAGQ